MKQLLQYDRHPRKMGDYNYVYFFMMLFVTIFIACDITAFRMTVFFGHTIPTSGLIIPLVFSLGDLVAEVYGYHISRKLIWNSLVCQFIFGILITIAIHFPSPSGNSENIHYNVVFQHIIRTNITSCLSVTSGMFTNAFLMSKLKIRMNGRGFWVRTILSSSVSEFVLCFVAYSVLYAGLKSVGEIWHIIITVWYYKLAFAMGAALIIPSLSRVVKRAEKSDVYDFNVNYNPFLYNGKPTQ